MSKGIRAVEVALDTGRVASCPISPQEYAQSAQRGGGGGRGYRGNRRGGPPRGNYTFTGTCYDCGVVGHMSRACPSKGAPVTAKVPPPAAKPPTAAAKGAASRRRQIPETYIEIELLGRATHCLVDTGCDQSMIPLRMIGGCPLHYTDM